MQFITWNVKTIANPKKRHEIEALRTPFRPRIPQSNRK
jgi:hypothetical protein